MSKRTYDALKIVSQILPILATLIFALGDTLGLAYAQQIAATIMAIEAALVNFLKVVSTEFFKDKEIIEKRDLSKEDRYEKTAI